MKKSEIIEGNKLIAEFMGYKQDGDKMLIYWNGKRKREELYIKHLEYNSSWDWLMPAWFKFQKQKIWKNKSSYLIAFRFAFCEGLEKQKIPHCWKALVAGIKWLNKQKQINKNQQQL